MTRCPHTPRSAGWLAAGIVAGLTVLAGAASPDLPPLGAETEAAWNRYVQAVEARRASEETRAGRFLAIDFAPNGDALRRRARAGELVVEDVPRLEVDGRELSVPRALVHHWRGVVFIPGMDAHRFVQALERDGPDTSQDDVLAGRIVERMPDGRQRVFLKIRRSKVVTVVYNTEHLVAFARPAAGRATSRSTATRIAQVDDAGQPGEREVARGDDSGFLWRWNAYWRYQDVDGGVLVECESLSLSRTVPAVVRFVAGPIINSTAREAMTSTLVALKARYGASGAR